MGPGSSSVLWAFARICLYVYLYLRRWPSLPALLSRLGDTRRTGPLVFKFVKPMECLQVTPRAMGGK